MKDNIIINKYSGFFLIELLIALGILAIFCLLINSFHANIAQTSLESRKYAKALNIINSFIEEMTVYGFKGNNKKIEDYTIEIMDILKVPFVNSQKGSKLKIFELKKIVISWISLNGKAQHISLVCGIIV